MLGEGDAGRETGDAKIGCFAAHAALCVEAALAFASPVQRLPLVLHRHQLMLIPGRAEFQLATLDTVGNQSE